MYKIFKFSKSHRKRNRFYYSSLRSSRVLLDIFRVGSSDGTSHIVRGFGPSCQLRVRSAGRPPIFLAFPKIFLQSISTDYNTNRRNFTGKFCWSVHNTTIGFDSNLSYGRNNVLLRMCGKQQNIGFGRLMPFFEWNRTVS